MMTTIQVDGEVVKYLKDNKVHPRQSYNEIIKELILSKQ
jgi:predicted CopG family antitoxin